MVDAFSPVKGKCLWWREIPNDEDTYGVRLKEHEKRVYCSCFVEGKGWTVSRGEVPEDCPDARMCRYYIKNV